MKKIIILFTITLSAFKAQSQNGWTEITDPLNSVNTFTPKAGYHGASWIDIDGDNDIDLFVAPKFLFVNDGAGNFQMSSAISGGLSSQRPTGSSWADFDNDGDMDCFLSRNPSRLFINDGLGNFIEDSAVFTSISNYPSWACSWGDVNNDGLLDILLAHPAGFLGPPSPCFYFKQNLQHQLEKVSGYFFTDSLKPYTVPYWSDYDLDGDADLFLASGPGGSAGPDFQYRNMLTETGVDTLILITNDLFSIDLHDGQCYSFIDYDNDRDFDLCLSSWNGSPTILYKNDNGIYNYVTTPFTVTKSSLANVWADFDNDGDLDLVIANDQYYFPEYYRNDGNDIFTTISNPLTAVKGASSIALGDYDNDGDLDAFIAHNDTTRGHALYRNDSVAMGNNWINILCKGTTANKSAIGAIVRLKCVINGNTVWQMREISAQNNFQGQSDVRVHFGLGNATTVDSLFIHYPGGHEDIYTMLPVNNFYFTEEGSSITTSVMPVKKKNDSLFFIYPNPVKEKLSIRFRNQTNAKFESRILNPVSKPVLVPSIRKESAELFSIDVSALKAGNYFLEITCEEKTFFREFIKLE